MVGAGAERLLSTDGALVRVHEISEELPAGWHLEVLQAEALSHLVERRGCRHGPRNSLQAILEERNRLLPTNDSRSNTSSTVFMHPCREKTKCITTHQPWVLLDTVQQDCFRRIICVGCTQAC